MIYFLHPTANKYWSPHYWVKSCPLPPLSPQYHQLHVDVADDAVLSDVPIPKLHKSLLGGVQVDDLVQPGVVEDIHPLGATVTILLRLAKI